MTDKRRHRNFHAPHGSVPNWVLVAFAAGAVAVVQFVHAVI
jgi:hypothetical protein